MLACRVCGLTPGVDSTHEDHAGCIAVYTAMACSEDADDGVIAAAPVLTIGTVSSSIVFVDAGRVPAAALTSPDDVHRTPPDKIPI